MANTAIQVTDLDFQEIKASLKSFLESQSEFTDYNFEGSGLNVLLDILAYNTHYNAYYLNMIANESFLDTATSRNSVVSHAKKYGYVPRSAKAPRAVVNIEITPSGSYTSENYTLPKYTRFVSEMDGKIYSFLSLEDYTSSKSGGVFEFSNVHIHEGTAINYSFVVNLTTNPNSVFNIPEIDIDTSTLIVSVKESSLSVDSTVFNLATDALNLTANSEVYFLQEAQNGNYDVYFGDGIISKGLTNGNIVNLTYLRTNAEEANRSNTFTAISVLSGAVSVVVDSITSATGGTERETIEQIKFAAPLNLLSQNRAVTKNDYIRLIQQKYPAFEAVNVWGGEENVPPVYGKVFIAAKPKLGFEITNTEKEFVLQKIIKPMSILTVTPEIVSVDYNYLKLETIVFYDKSKTSLSDSELKTGIRNSIVNYCSTNLNQFNSYFKYSGLETTIDAYSKAIVSNEVTLFVAKKFRPVLDVSGNYELNYGFELVPGTTSDNFYSSPDFTILDEEGNYRSCFFEEIPSSFTGVESIMVSNPGLNYTSTPTITIIGDGEGATAVATITNGKITSIEVTNPGINYTTAAVSITGGGDGILGEGLAVLEGRFGQIRISYYRKEATSNQNTKVIINKDRDNGVIGTIDYFAGKINLIGFKPIAVNNSFGDIMIHMKPKISVIQSKLNKMLVLDDEDSTSISIKTVAI